MTAAQDTLVRPAEGPTAGHQTGLGENAACVDEASARLAHLFRRSFAANCVHPLLHVLKLYHGVHGGLPPSEGRAEPVSAPRVPLTREMLRAGMAALPSLPTAVADALRVLNAEGASMDEVALRIERDQVLAARTLRAANSAFFGVQGRVGTIRLAISVLGLRAVAALLTTAAVSAQFDGCARCPGFHYRAYWRHAMTTALVARGLARQVGLDPELAFTAGLLHDIGMLVLATQHAQAYAEVLRYARGADVSMRDAERTVLELDHGDVGDLLAQHWHLPAPVGQAIASHHALPTNPGEALTLAEVVHVAEAMAHGIAPAADTADEAVPDVSVRVWARMGLDAADAVRMLQHAADGVDALCEALAL